MTSTDHALTADNPAQIADYPAGDSFGPRRLLDYELVWLMAGSARLTLDSAPARDEEYGRTLRPGDVAITRPGERDHYDWDRTAASRHAYLHFTLDSLGALPDPSTWPRVRTFAELSVLAALCDYLLVLAEDDGGSARRRSTQVLHWVVDLFVTAPIPSDPMADLPHPVVRALEEVRRLWAVDGLCLVRIPDLAAAVHVSSAHLHRTFQESLGLGPARCLELVRLWQAATALQRSGATVSEVGQRCGYSDRFHFSRRFRALYGISPRQVRTDAGTIDPAGPLRSAGLLGAAQWLLSPAR